eukprot:gnl/MRDRNA2_/MRDRNA2_100188_c0_seq1.p1 gnl/MRDRNA2_/MRDRNA2_100188_c0~~gnl/MRDRNA2_/MRDRNA2_100188_c0_seq1.p1  ORF type:complete len:579 (+),score=131.57 gnl/MRDRNA2_/MRDRNA2_100188_c0_seq1:91-1737(+)
MSDVTTVVRALAEDSEDLGAGAGAAIALASVFFCILAAVGLVRLRKAFGHGSKVANVPTQDMDHGKSWGQDPEKGEVPEFAPEPEKVPSTKSSSLSSWLCSCFGNRGTSSNGPLQLCVKQKGDASSPSPSKGRGKVEFSPAAQQQLGSLLRELLEQEVSESLKHGLMGRLDALEQELVEALKKDTYKPMPPAVAPPISPPVPPTKPPTENRDGASQTSPPALKFEKGIPAQEDLGFDSIRDKPKVPEKSFGPTKLQRKLPKPPEKPAPLVPETVALKSSLAAVQQCLGSRDRQTTELQKQLKECRQALWDQTQISSASEERLQRLLAAPGRAPQVQAEEIARLQDKISALSSRLADAKSGETYWSVVAKRQRAYFLQSEQHGPEAAQFIKKHPCGEVFVAPPPILGEAGDMGPAFDVGTSFANPYVCDSWPFEPNVLAKRTPQEPTMQPLEEDPEAESEVDDEDDEEEVECVSPSKKAMHGVRLPSLPIASTNDEGRDSDEDSLIEVPHGTDDNEVIGCEDDDNRHAGASVLDRLPQMPTEVETARSL